MERACAGRDARAEARLHPVGEDTRFHQRYSPVKRKCQSLLRRAESALGKDARIVAMAGHLPCALAAAAAGRLMTAASWVTVSCVSSSVSRNLTAGIRS